MKKQQQLGMNPSTASNRLGKDILFMLVQNAGHKCFKCGGEMERENFSIEHKIPWLDSPDPKAMFFDLNNIAFSHLSCNIKDGRKRDRKGICGTVTSYEYGCRCRFCIEAKAEHRAVRYTPERRSERYRRTGN